MRGKGEGTVYQRADGKWVAQVDAGRDPASGRRRRPTRVRATKKAAADALQQLRRQVGVPAAVERITVGQWCDTWLADCADRVRAGTMAPTTAAGYESKVRLSIVPAIGHVRLDQLSVGHVQRMLTGARASGLEAGSVRGVRAVLSAALSAAIADGLIQVNVARQVQATPMPTPNPSAFSEEEMVAIVEACREHRLGDAFLFDALTGLRTSELIGLRWEDVDLEERTYRIVEGLHRLGAVSATNLGLEAGLVTSPPKSVRSGRDTPMSPAAAQVLSRHRRRLAAEQLAAPVWTDSGRVFTSKVGTPLDPGDLRRAWKSVLKAAGVPLVGRGGRGRGLHELRRTYATRLRQAGVPIEEVQALGRWSSPSMLLRFYRSVDDAELRTAAGQGDGTIEW